MLTEPAEVLIVEDTPNDLELTLRALKKNNVTNSIQSVKDGAEALDYLFSKGHFSDREAVVKPVDYSKFAESITRIGLYWLGLNHPRH